jgi:hypothetical protein
MQINWLAVFGAALVPLVVGMIWYNKNVFGTVWMKAAGVDPEQAKKSNMWIIFGTTILMSVMLAMMVPSIVIHQFHVGSVFQGDDSMKGFIEDFLTKYGSRFRSFKHGALHGTIAGVFMALPVLTINSLFEGKSFKYVTINAGYWIVCLAIMGGIVGQFA